MPGRRFQSRLATIKLNSKMNSANNAKPYWEMTKEELREATKEFDKEFVFERARPMSPEMKSRWQRAKRKAGPTPNGESTQTADHWFFNTDETESEGEGAYREMRTNRRRTPVLRSGGANRRPVPLEKLSANK